jgi:hypothetical protein
MLSQAGEFFRKHHKELFLSFSLVLILFFLAPLSIYIGNADIFQYAFKHIWYILLLVTLIVSLILAGITIALRSLFKYFFVFYIVIAAGVIIQGYFLNYYLGALDGQDILWESFRLQCILESFLWIGLAFIGFFLKKLLHKNAVSIGILLIALQTTPILVNYSLDPPPDQGVKTYINPADQVNFSTSKNVVLIVLDAFRSDAFEYLIQESPEYKLVFKDFTYFNDAIGGYPTTRPSIPLILTGQYYKNDLPMDDFLSQLEDHTLPVYLIESDFIVEHYPLVPFFNSVFDNTTSDIPAEVLRSYVEELYWVSGIRYMPLLLKPHFVTQFYEGEDYYHKDMVSFYQRISETQGIDSDPRFKLIHLTGAHAPYQLDRDLNRVESDYYEQVAASLNIVAELIVALKKEAVYDNSLILIFGDHGTQTSLGTQEFTLPHSVKPLLMAKNINQSSDTLQISDAPVSLADIPKTIADVLAIDNEFPGYSLFVEIPGDRDRVWYYYEWTHSSWGEDYLPIMYEISIQGPANDRTSYQLSGIYPPESDPKGLPFFSNDHFGQNLIEIYLSDLVVKSFLSENFSFEKSGDQTFTWASGPSACLNLPITPTDEKLILTFEGHPFLFEGAIEDQRMEVYINDIHIDTFNKNSIYKIFIPKELTTQVSVDYQINICLNFPDANKSPKDLGLNLDERILGYRFTSIMITTEQ